MSTGGWTEPSTAGGWGGAEEDQGGAAAGPDNGSEEQAEGQRVQGGTSRDEHTEVKR